MKSNSLTLVILAIVAAFLFFFEPQLGWWARNGLSERFGGGAADEKNLALENEKLRAEVAELSISKKQAPNLPADYLRAAVYSRYPLNFKNELLINAGKSEGVASGAAVTFGGVLIGKIKDVYGDKSLARTVFDSGFQEAVRVGSSGAEALLRGGVFPMATLIPLQAPIAPGDIVYSASRDFPYGLPIGEVATVNISSDKLFQEATLKFAYDINSIQTVLLEKQ